MLLDSLLPNRPKLDIPQKKKILCIIEGDTEFRYITKLFKLSGYVNSSNNKDCFNLSENHIKIAWGKNFTPNINIVKETKKGCTFEGGNSGKETLPFQSVSAFEMFKDDLSIFDSILVVFDGDKDTNNEVAKYFEVELPKIDIDNLLIISDPCFESTLIDYCTCDECKDKMAEIANSNPPCKKYKENIKNLPCFQKSETANGFIANLTQENFTTLKDKESTLNVMNNLISNYMVNIKTQ